MSSLYPNALDQFATGAWGWKNDAFAFALVTAATGFVAENITVDDLPAGAVLVTSGSLQNPQTSSGWLISDDVLFTDLSVSEPVGKVILVRTTDSPHALLCYFDGVVGLPYQMSGGEYWFRRDNVYPGWCQI